MKALLIVAHGSRRQTSNDEVRKLTARLSQAVDHDFKLIMPAFLELADPAIPVAIKQCADAGATDIVVVPYFLSAGRHVVEDIPAEVKKGAALVAGVNVRLTSHLGSSESVLSLLLKLAVPD